MPVGGIVCCEVGRHIERCGPITAVSGGVGKVVRKTADRTVLGSQAREKTGR
jgi:hypothetical protein